MIIAWLWCLLVASILVLIGFITIKTSTYFYRKEKIKQMRRNSNLPDEKP